MLPFVNLVPRHFNTHDWGHMHRKCLIVLLITLMLLLIASTCFSSHLGRGLANLDGPKLVFVAGYSLLRWIVA
jgi:hypothetical protein